MKFLILASFAPRLKISNWIYNLIIRVKSLLRGWGTLTRPFCSIYGRPLPENYFSKPIRRLKPIERSAEEANSFLLSYSVLKNKSADDSIIFERLQNCVKARWHFHFLLRFPPSNTCERVDELRMFEVHVPSSKHS